MRALNAPRAATHYLQSLEDTWRSCMKALVTGAVKVVRWAAAPSRKQSPACPCSHGSELRQTHSHLVCKTSLWSFCWVPEMIRPFTKSFSSISVIFEIKAAVWGRLEHESSRSRGRKCKTGDSQRSTQVSVWWSNMQNRLWPWVAHRLGVQGASLWKKTFQLLVDRSYGILETNRTLEEGSGKALIRRRERKEEKSRRGMASCPFLWCLWREEFYPAKRRWLWRPLKEQLAAACSLWWA